MSYVQRLAPHTPPSPVIACKKIWNRTMEGKPNFRYLCVAEHLWAVLPPRRLLALNSPNAEAWSVTLYTGDWPTRSPLVVPSLISSCSTPMPHLSSTHILTKREDRKCCLNLMAILLWRSATYHTAQISMLWGILIKAFRCSWSDRRYVFFILILWIAVICISVEIKLHSNSADSPLSHNAFELKTRKCLRHQ